LGFRISESLQAKRRNRQHTNNATARRENHVFSETRAPAAATNPQEGKDFEEMNAKHEDKRDPQR
jgi:hypothetical protein